MPAPTGTTLPSYSQAYSYDSLDRISSSTPGTYSYADANQVHAVTSVSSIPNQYAAYDAMGNMTCRNTDTTSGHTCAGSSPTGAQLSYDVEGRLVSWTAPSGTVGNASYLYDNQGNRVLTHAKSASATTNTISFDGYTETVLNGSSTTTTKYYTTSGQRVAVRVGSANLDYLVSDPLGSNTVAFNSTGQVVALQHYSPYGTGDYSWGTMPTTYNYATQRLDSQTGLLYDNFRYYDPLIGRYVRSDNVQDNATGMDPYAYVGDNPESRNDPTGHRMLGVDGVSEGNIGPTGYLVMWKPGSRGLIWDYSTSAETQRYTYYNPNTDTTNSPMNKFNQATGLTDVQNTFNNPSASAWDKTTAIGNFVGTNANNLFQLAMILGGGEGEGAELGGETLIKDVADLCGGGLSFTSTTPVATEHGKQAIGTLEVGEKVWAYNPQTHQMELEPIQHLWLNHDSDLVDLTLTTTVKESHGKAIQNEEVIHTNERHPFLTKEKGFLPVSQLMVGMHIRRANGSYGVVAKLVVVSGAKWMYNLQIAHDHTYTVGMAQWIVHNACGNPLFRVLRPDEDPANGLYPKDPSANKTVFQHIRNGSQPGFQSQYISTTNDLGVALRWGLQSGARIAEIDSSQVEGNIIDVSTRDFLAPHGINYPSPAYSYAISSQETLIDGYVPPEAIRWVNLAEDLANSL